ncbi:MAG: DUF3135 domain-containing protein [Gammaproteobacteria bacterium]|jgi:hypothetical protein
MQKNTLKILDFDVAMELARTDPEAFEQYRQNVIEALIARSAERNRQQLRCLQWRIDKERERAATPFAACIKLYRMMWESFAGKRGLIDSLHHANHTPQRNERQRPEAKVIAFPKTSTTKDPAES